MGVETNRGEWTRKADRLAEKAEEQTDRKGSLLITTPNADQVALLVEVGVETNRGEWTRKADRLAEKAEEQTDRKGSLLITTPNADLQFVLFVGWLLNVPATGECISGTDLLRQFYVLPH